MRLLLHSGSERGTDRRYVGGYLTPSTRAGSGRYWADRGLPWAIDNDCFGPAWAPAAFVRCLRRNQGVPGCCWAVVPDRVGDAAGTDRRWRGWAWLVRAAGYPLAYVGQDGATAATVPWAHMAALFVGGTTAWKLGSAAAVLVGEAQARGKHVHMGRVNSRVRLSYAASLGCSSIDGLCFNRYSGRDLPWGMAWVRARQGRLWTAQEETA